MNRLAIALAAVTLGLSSLGCTVTVQAGDRGDAALRDAGWTKLGERWVDSKADRDTVQVGASEGRFRSIMIVVEHSALEMNEIDVEFGDKSHFKPEVRHTFAQNSRSRVIDLPGDRRVVRNVTFKYGNLPGGGKAQVELWAK